MADFTAAHAKQIADDAVIRNLIERRAIYNALLTQAVATDSPLLSVISGKYGNVTNDNELRAIVETARVEDAAEIKARIIEILPPV